MKILEVELLTDNVNRTEVFYNEVVGLNTLTKNDCSVAFMAGATKVTFRFSENLNPVYHFALDVPNGKLVEALSYIEKQTAVLEVIPPDKIADFFNWNAKSFYFYDNNGNVLEFIVRYNLDNKSDANFCGSSIISISEIGFRNRNWTLCTRRRGERLVSHQNKSKVVLVESDF